MFYLFNKNGVTATFCADKERLFDMFSVEEEITEKDDDGNDIKKIVKKMPDGYSIKEYNGGASTPGALYLDKDGNVCEREITIDEEVEKEQAKTRALDELDKKYRQDKEVLAEQYLDAAMSDDKDTMATIKQELIALNEKYDTDYKSIKGDS